MSLLKTIATKMKFYITTFSRAWGSDLPPLLPAWNNFRTENGMLEQNIFSFYRSIENFSEIFCDKNIRPETLCLAVVNWDDRMSSFDSHLSRDWSIMLLWLSHLFISIQFIHWLFLVIFIFTIILIIIYNTHRIWHLVAPTWSQS